MWDEAMKAAWTQGVFAVLFVALLATTIGLVRWVLGISVKREERLIGVIESQSAAYQGLHEDVNCVKNDVKEIKGWIIRPE